ncbi:MAG: rhomboid family intramembrane serine protease [Nitrososphaera sp.]|jgi:rhomboid protease GluP
MSASGGLPVVVIALVVLNIAAYLVSIDASYGISKRALLNYAFVPAYLFSDPSRAILTIFTSMFLHANVAHIALNMMALVAVGRYVEASLGHWRFLLIYVISGVAAALLFGAVQFGLSDPSTHLVGASGAISGIIGTSVILGNRGAFGWFAMQLILGFVSLGGTGFGGIAFMAHVGGFLAGIGMTRLLILREKASRQLA